MSYHAMITYVSLELHAATTGNVDTRFPDTRNSTFAGNTQFYERLIKLVHTSIIWLKPEWINFRVSMVLFSAYKIY